MTESDGGFRYLKEYYFRTGVTGVRVQTLEEATLGGRVIPVTVELITDYPRSPSTRSPVPVVLPFRVKHWTKKHQIRSPCDWSRTPVRPPTYVGCDRPIGYRTQEGRDGEDFPTL